MKEINCIVNEEKCLFHCWEQWSQVIEPSLMTGGHPGGQISQMFGIVEFEDGSVKRVHPYEVKFIKKRGEWIHNGLCGEWQCSECKCQISLSDDRNSHPNFCPNCGTDMRKKKKDD